MLMNDSLDTLPSGFSYRIFAGLLLALIASYLINNVTTFWFNSPGVLNVYAHYELFGLIPDADEYSSSQLLMGYAQIGVYLASFVLVVLHVRAHPGFDGILKDAKLYSEVAAYIIRVAFWASLLIGLTDAIISFLRVEDFLEGIVGEELTKELGRPHFRGLYVHYPLIIVSGIIAFLSRSLSFIWLALLVVFSEFQIVILRFVFSYEQAFMGDLVRFWYAGLFLFASSYALVTGGHVRVDVLYAHLGKRKKAWTNAVGSLLLGLPICYTILVLGLWGKGSSLNSPLLSYEISQSGFGMYVKYLMAGFLVIFALSMLIQFTAYFLENVAVLLRGDKDNNDATSTEPLES